MEENNLKKIYLLLGIGVLIISFSGILIKIASAPPLIIAFYRMAFSSLILTPYFLLKYRNQASHFLDYRPVVVGLLLALHFITWITAFEYTNVANAVIFVAMQPLFTLILEVFFAREDLKEGVVVGILLAIAGSIIISIGELNILGHKILGDLLAFIASFFAASYLFIGRSIRKEMDYFPYLYIIYTYAAFFLGIFVLFTGLPLSGYEKVNYLYFLGLALGPTLVGHSIFNYSVRFLPTTIVSLSIMGEPILTTFWAWLILGEKITLATSLGAILILGGIYRSTVGKGSGRGS